MVHVQSTRNVKDVAKGVKEIKTGKTGMLIKVIVESTELPWVEMVLIFDKNQPKAEKVSVKCVT